jgi:hypothetical protein
MLLMSLIWTGTILRWCTFEGRKKERIVEFEEIGLQAALAIPSNAPDASAMSHYLLSPSSFASFLCGFPRTGTFSFVVFSMSTLLGIRIYLFTGWIVQLEG